MGHAKVKETSRSCFLMILRLDSDGNPKLSADSNLVLAVLASSPRGGSHVKRTGVLVIPFRDLKKKTKTKTKKTKTILLRTSGVFSLKRSTAGTFAIPFRVLSRKNMTGDNVFF